MRKYLLIAFLAIAAPILVAAKPATAAPSPTQILYCPCIASSFQSQPPGAQGGCLQAVTYLAYTNGSCLRGAGFSCTQLQTVNCTVSVAIIYGALPEQNCDCVSPYQKTKVGNCGSNTIWSNCYWIYGFNCNDCQ